MICLELEAPRAILENRTRCLARREILGARTGSKHSILEPGENFEISEIDVPSLEPTSTATAP